MQILMLNHNVIWRSTFFRAFYFARELVRRGHRVAVVTISPDRLLRARAQQLEGVEVIETPDVGVSLARTGWDPWDALYRCMRLSRPDFDVVHGFDCRPVVLAPSLWLKPGGACPGSAIGPIGGGVVAPSPSARASSDVCSSRPSRRRSRSAFAASLPNSR